MATADLPTTGSTRQRTEDADDDDLVQHVRHLDAGVVEEARASADFVELRRRLRSFVFPMTAVFLAWFLLLILCASYARGFMAKKVLGEINVGYVFALLQFVSTFLIAWLYSRFAGHRLDPLADQLRADIEERSR